jgi:hypothetical protein
MSKTRWDYAREQREALRRQKEQDEYEREAMALETVADESEEPDDDDGE